MDLDEDIKNLSGDYDAQTSDNYILRGYVLSSTLTIY